MTPRSLSGSCCICIGSGASLAGMQSRCRLPFPSSFKCEEHQSSPRSTTSLQERPSLSLTTNRAAQTNQSADRPSLIGVGFLQLDCLDFSLEFYRYTKYVVHTGWSFLRKSFPSRDAGLFRAAASFHFKSKHTPAK